MKNRKEHPFSWSYSPENEQRTTMCLFIVIAFVLLSVLFFLLDAML